MSLTLSWQLLAPEDYETQGLNCLQAWRQYWEVLVVIFLTALRLLPGKLTLLPFPRWTRAHELLSQQKIQKGDLAQIVRESDVMLRYGLGVQLPAALSLLPLCEQVSLLSP